MPHLTIYSEHDTDSTAVSNLFIDEYMKDANDAQLKVYFYLLRMMSARQATSVPDIADRFNHTEKDVIRALKYWQKRNLLDLDYDEEKNLVGIHIHDLVSRPRENISRNLRTVSTFVPAPVSEEDSAAPVSMEPPAPKAIRSEPSAEPSPFQKPAYSADQLKEFKSHDKTAQLLFIAESYIGRPLTPADMKTILYFIDVLHFSDDLIDYLIQYCVDRGKKDFKYIEKVAVNWAENGITTPEQAQKTSCRYDRNIYAIMNGLGKDGSPTNREMDYISRWLNEYGFSTDIIIEACERTVLATDRHRFEYADGILNSWKQQNVHHKSDISKIDDAHRQKKKNPAPSKTTNRFNQFTQNHYDFEMLEQELLSN
ncbi:MAG: DnaD domain protein [Lachnospiraceae bacterium]|jgi:DnaD/phage-associated family protein|nr:DnaD domain protein [Lachnospiraceae bacterium]